MIEASTTQRRKQMNAPVRIRIKTSTGNRTYFGGYHLIAKYRDLGRLVCAYSTSTGKSLA
jgi:ribosomal protein L16/L10AE